MIPVTFLRDVVAQNRAFIVSAFATTMQTYESKEGGLMSTLW